VGGYIDCEKCGTSAMTAMEHTALGQALRAVVPCIETPTLQKVVDALFNPSLAADGSVTGHRS